MNETRGPAEDDALHEILSQLEEKSTVPAALGQELPDALKARLAKIQHALIILRRASRQACTDGSTESAELSGVTPAEEPQGLPPSNRYRFVRRLGEGGFGIVFLAYDVQLNRDVAIKLPRPDIFLTKSMAQRFLREAQNVAKLAHPNIVPVLATDESSAMPAIVYHFCDGPTLAQWLRATPGNVPVLTVARIGLLLAEAVQHAHSRGILHRDLKPSNILLEPSTDQHAPYSFQEDERCWVPRIIDFGMSKATEVDSGDTATVAVLGTPPYMPPEQLAGRAREVGTHSDVYSLGVVLYELLTKQRPYSANSAGELLVQIRSTDVPSLRKLRPGCSLDLEAIVLRCLNVDEGGRYPTAAELAADLRRFLDGKPVSVRSHSSIGRLKKWAFRQPVVASLIAACALLMLFGIGATFEYVRRANVLIHRLQMAEGEATDAVRDLRQQLYAADVSAASEAFEEGDIIRYHSLLASHISPHSADDLRDMAWYHLWGKGHRDHCATAVSSHPLYAIRFSRDGRYVALCGADGKVRLADTRTRAVSLSWDTKQSELNCASFSEDGRHLVVTGDDGTVTIWETSTKQLANRFKVHAEHAFQAVFVSGGRLITCGDEPTIRVWDWQTGTEIKTLEKHTKTVQSITLSNDGHRLFSASDDGTRCSWNLETLECDSWSQASGARCLDVEPSASGRWLFSSHVDGTIQRDTIDSVPHAVETIAAMPDSADAIAVSPDGSRIAIATRVGVIRVVHLNDNGLAVVTPEDSGGWLAHDGRIHDLAFSPDGMSLHSVGADGIWRKWDTLTPPSSAMLDTRKLFPPSHQFAIALAQLNADTCVFTADTGMFTWNCVSDRVQRIGNIQESVSRLATNDTGGLLFTGHFGGSVQAWHVTEQHARELWTYAWPEGAAAISGLAYSHPRGEIAVAVEGAKEMRILRASTGEELNRLALPEGVGGDNDGNMAFSRNGKWLAAAWDHNVVVWDLAGGTVRKLEGHTNMVSALCFHPSSDLLFSGADDRMIRIWDVSESRCLAVLGHHKDTIISLASSADGRTILSTSCDGRTALWHEGAKRLLFDFDSKEEAIVLSCNWIGDRLFRIRGSVAIDAHEIGMDLPRKSGQ